MRNFFKNIWTTIVVKLHNIFHYIFDKPRQSKLYNVIPTASYH